MSNFDNLSSIVNQAVDNRLKNLHTSMPGIVQSFDSATQTCSVQPAIKRVFITRESDQEILTPSNLPKLINVPVIFPRGGGYCLTFPVKSGDECLLIFAERAIDDWYFSGQVKKPTSKRFHSLADAVAYVGLASKPKSISNFNVSAAELKSENEAVKITMIEGGTINISADATVNVMTPVSNFNGDLNVTGTISAPTISADTSLTIAGAEVKNHTHAAGTYKVGTTPVTGDSAPLS